MRSHHCRGVVLAAVLLVVGLTLFAVSCGSSEGTAAEVSSAAESGSIVISGLVDYPMTLTALDMDYMDWTTLTLEHPELGATEYEGVRLSDIFAYVGVQAEATRFVIKSSDGSAADVAIVDIASENAMIAVGEGGVINAAMPGMGSDAWAEDIVSMEFK